MSKFEEKLEKYIASYKEKVGGELDEEVADVMNYTVQTWNKGDIVTVEEVAAVEEI